MGRPALGLQRTKFIRLPCKTRSVVPRARDPATCPHSIPQWPQVASCTLDHSPLPVRRQGNHCPGDTFSTMYGTIKGPLTVFLKVTALQLTAIRLWFLFLPQGIQVPI